MKTSKMLKIFEEWIAEMREYDEGIDREWENYSNKSSEEKMLDEIFGPQGWSVEVLPGY